MPILSHSKSGLILDVFGEKKEILNVDQYVVNNNILLYNIKKIIYKYDLLKNKILFSKNFDYEIYELKLLENGSFAVLFKNSILNIFKNNQFTNEFKKVSAFELGDSILAVENETDFFVYDIVNQSVIYKTIFWFKSFIIINDFCLITTDKCNKDQDYKIIKVNKSGEQIIHTFKSLVDTKCKFNTDYVLMSVSTSYVKNSYYASTILFLYDIKKNKFDRVGNINNIQDFTFIKDGFCVCYGNQPADVTLYNFNLEIINKFPKGIRNRIKYNEFENFVAMAGFDQLAGDIELYNVELKKKLNTINELGASKLEWEKNGSFFYVSTYKLLIDDNRIVKYDYYGRKIKEEKFDVLHNSTVYGIKEKFIELKDFEKVQTASSNVYVPSCLKGKTLPTNNKLLIKSKLKEKPKKIKETKEELLKKLEKITELKNKVKNREKITTDEMNLLLKEDRIKNEINKK